MMRSTAGDVTLEFPYTHVSLRYRDIEKVDPSEN